MSKAITQSGGPAWVALATADPSAAAAFYGRIFGWTPEPDQAATMPNAVLLNGRPVAGIGPASAGLHPAWRLYFGVADVQATVLKAVEAGGTVVQPPAAFGTAGKSAVLTDQSGAEFAIWDGDVVGGTAARARHGTLAWSELITDDVGASYTFYRKVLGWGLSEPAIGGPAQRREWQGGGRSIAGLLPRPPAMPKTIPPYWDVIFSVADPAATVALAVSLGATSLMPPTDIPHGRIAVLADPTGIVFSVIRPAVEPH
jgi:hypothetical protein